MDAIPAKLAGVQADRHGHARPAADGEHRAGHSGGGKDRGGGPDLSSSAVRRPSPPWPIGTETRARRWTRSSAPATSLSPTAKRQVFGLVNIDMIAGPSEILVVADGAADPAWVAADLLSQAEHDKLATAVLVTDSPSAGRGRVRPRSNAS